MRTVLGRLCVMALLLLAPAAPDADAAYRLCAFRSGPQGPCTCKSDSDGPGQFSIAPKSRCAAAIPPPEKKPDDTQGTAAQAVPATTAQDPATPAAPPGSVAPADTGALPVAPAAPAADSGLAAIRARGKLRCGVNTGLLGFSAQTQSGQWAGIDADFCRAVAAAVFADPGKVDFVPLDASARFEALASGRIDLLSRNTTWTMNRDVDMGLDFAGVLYFDGQGFMTSADRGLVSAQQLAGSSVCVQAGTTTEKNMAYYFKTHDIQVETKTYPTRIELIKAYTDGTCDAISADRSALFSERAGMAEPLKHDVLPEVISKEPLGPVVAEGDRALVEVVKWTLAALVNAEEVGLDKAAAAASVPLGDDATRLIEGAGASGVKLGLSKAWLRDTVSAVGNYGEMFDANLGSASPLGMERGINALWKKGGLVYAPPMW